MQAYIPIAGKLYSITQDGIITDSRYIEHNGKTLESILTDLMREGIPGSFSGMKFDLHFSKDEWSIQFGRPRYRINLQNMFLQNSVFEGVYMKDIETNLEESYKSIPIERKILSNGDVLLTAHEAFDGFIRFIK